MTATLATTHANYSPDWWTPPEWLEWVSASLGPGWFDPCPGDWQPGDPSGLEIEWPSPSYVNHPGSRGSAAVWWDHYLAQGHRFRLPGAYPPIIWCAFSVEQLRHMTPSPLELPGTLIAPRSRVAFIWGGPDGFKGRVHGERQRSPTNWTVFWASKGVEVVEPPVESIVVPTGMRSALLVRAADVGVSR